MNITPAPPQACPIEPHPAAAFARRFSEIIAQLHRLVGLRALLLGPFAYFLQNRLGRAARRIAAILERHAAGRLPRIHPPRPGRTASAPAPHVPRRHGWLVEKLGYHAAASTCALEYLFSDPATRQVLAEAPPLVLARLGRTLRPVCRLLGVTLPPALQAPRRIRPPRPAAIPAPPAQTPAGSPSSPTATPTTGSRPRPALPLYPQRRPRPLPFPLDPAGYRRA